MASIFVVFSSIAQTIYQDGMAREINSNKTPLGGVFIKFENAPSAVSGDDGIFQLAFKNQKVGNPITQLNNQIRSETDTLKLYQLYTTLCDTLRTYSKEDKKYQLDFAQALNSRAWYGFFLKEFKGVESDIREAMAFGIDNKYLATNLPPALLLQGKYEEAVAEYRKYKDLPFGEQGIATYGDAFLDDLKAFEAAGIIPKKIMKDVERIRDILKGK